MIGILRLYLMIDPPLGVSRRQMAIRDEHRERTSVF